MLRASSPVIVQRKSGIAAVLCEVWGWMPSDRQVYLYAHRKQDPLPVFIDAGRWCADEDLIKCWAREHRSEIQAV